MVETQTTSKQLDKPPINHPITALIDGTEALRINNTPNAPHSPRNNAQNTPHGSLPPHPPSPSIRVPPAQKQPPPASPPPLGFAARFNSTPPSRGQFQPGSPNPSPSPSPSPSPIKPPHSSLLRNSGDDISLGKARRISPATSGNDLLENERGEGGLAKYLFLKILFPWNDRPGSVYKVRKFLPELTVDQAIAELNAHLSDAYRSDKNKLYFNGAPLEGSKPLSSFGFQATDILHFKREPEYEFSTENPKQGGTLVMDHNLVIHDVIKKMLVWILGGIPASSEQDARSSSPSFKLYKKLQAHNPTRKKAWGIRLMEMKHLSDYGIRKRDVLQLVVKMGSVNSLELDASADTVQFEENIYEINIEDAPVTSDVGMEDEKDPPKEEEKPPAEKKTHKRVPSLLKRESEKSLSSSSLVGAPYNVVHKSHVNFDYQWTGNAVSESFEYKEKLGQGGYGAVFKAVHKETGFTLAIKALAMNGPGRSDLQKEIDILKKCRCPNVLSYYGSTVVKNEIWILMDLCSVGSAKDLMKTCVETLDEVQIAMVAREVLKGLAYLHELGIVHMDVKAANILLTEDGGVKLADFGVSQQLQNSTSQSDVLIGSPLWMAPEIILKNPYDHKADTWSLGITLIELAEGRAPPRGLRKIEDLVAAAALPPPSLANPRSWSPSFIDFVSKCLTKDPQSRPSATNLLTHPFIEGANGPEVLTDLIRTCMQIKAAKHEKEISKTISLAVA